MILALFKIPFTKITHKDDGDDDPQTASNNYLNPHSKK